MSDLTNMLPLLVIVGTLIYGYRQAKALEKPHPQEVVVGQEDRAQEDHAQDDASIRSTQPA